MKALTVLVAVVVVLTWALAVVNAIPYRILNPFRKDVIEATGNDNSIAAHFGDVGPEATLIRQVRSRRGRDLMTVIRRHRGLYRFGIESSEEERGPVEALGL